MENIKDIQKVKNPEKIPYEDWTLEMILGYKEKYKKDIPYHLIAHGYLLLNIEIFKILSKKNQSLDDLRNKFNELLEKLEKIQLLKPETILDDKDKIKEGKESIWNNKNIVMNSMNQFLAIIQDKEQRQQFNKTKKYAIISLIISGIALIINTMGLIICIFFK
ncbi:MAG: hypothetical protein ACTSRP_00035 [Candidatus Helarchaeota archaeon]